MVKLLIFDMDGTLIDTDKVLLETWKELFKLYKPSDYVVDEEVVRTFSGPPIQESIAKAFPEKDQSFILKEYRARTEKYYDYYLKIYPGEKEVLERLSKEGYILAIATQKNKKMALKSLEMQGIYDYFSLILTSNDGFKTKPSPDMINYILANFDCKPEEAIMIGDTAYDYLAAKNAGVRSILFKGSKRTYSEEVDPLGIFSSYEEIYHFLKQLV
ncbi:MAG: HAD family hydrolase [Bacilli bacterium]|nr:HAD family hydrolase [Bacilli bacterium]